MPSALLDQGLHRLGKSVGIKGYAITHAAKIGERNRILLNNRGLGLSKCDGKILIVAGIVAATGRKCRKKAQGYC